jgi:uncharacterized protein (DUF427 family)
MKATIDGTVIADAPESDLISIEDNYYFPPSSLSADVFSDSPTPYTRTSHADIPYVQL